MAYICGCYATTSMLPSDFIYEEDGSDDSKLVVRYPRHIWDLLDRVSEFRFNNGGDLAPGWEARTMYDICKKYNLPGCDCDGWKEPTPRKIGLHDVAVFGHTVKSWISSGGEWVDDELAMKRASICEACPYNVTIVGCKSCLVLPALLPKDKKALVKGRDLNGCWQCGCQLSVKVFIPADVLSESTKDTSKYPAKCWIRKEISGL